MSGWLRPDAATSPERLFCHCYGRGKNSAQMIPGWPYSFVAALERGRSSWTALLDAVRLGPADDLTAVTAAQVREVTGRIIAAGHWRDGDPDILVIFDAGYDLARLAWLLKDLPVQVLGRLGSNRVLHQPPPPREPGQMGRPLRHGPGFRLAAQAARPAPEVTTITQTSRYGTAAARAWHRVHPKLHARGAWAGHDGELPVIEGTLIQLTVDHLPHERHPKPVWLWASSHRRRQRGGPLLASVLAPFRHRTHVPVPQTGPRLDRAETPRPGRRRPVDLADHRRPRPAAPRPPASRRPAPAVAAARPARPVHPRPGPPRIPEHPRHAAQPTAAPKPGKPGPGRPPGSRNRHPATHHDVGKNPATRHPQQPSKKIKG